MKLGKKNNIYKANFKTNLNATMSMTVFAPSREKAIKIVKREFPSAYDIELNR